MSAESMCDTCLSPGACCKRIFLSNHLTEDLSRRPQESMSFEAAEHVILKLGYWMFRPSHQDEFGRWQWFCTQLQSDGRCGIYVDRPDLCRRYRPGEDGLCVHFWPDPETDRIADLAAEVAALEEGAIS